MMDSRKELEYLTLILRHLTGMQNALKDYLELRKQEEVMPINRKESNG